jgi:hypothetical protein
MFAGIWRCVVGRVASRRFEAVHWLWFQASAAMLVRSALFWGVTQRRVIKGYHSTLRNIPQECRSQFKDCLTLWGANSLTAFVLIKTPQILRPTDQDSCVEFMNLSFRIAAGKWVSMLTFFLTLCRPTRQALVTTESDRFLPPRFRYVASLAAWDSTQAGTPRLNERTFFCTGQITC